MKRLVLILGALLAAPLAAGAQQTHTCGTGTLRNTEAITETFATPTQSRVTTKRDKDGERKVLIDSTPREARKKKYVVEVQLEDVVYTAESAGNFWNYDPTRLVINDPVGVCVVDKQIILKRPDGKDYKAKITRAVRSER